MKTLQTMAIFALSYIFASCQPTTDSAESANSEKVYNVAVILDGTDRLTNSNAISQISTAELTDLARKIAENGTGSLFVTYVDRDCSNNHFALFEIWELKPKEPGTKKEYVTKNSYDKLVQEYDAAALEYQQMLADALDRFSYSCEKVTKAAYSDQTASEKYGSDVYGAVNKALKATGVNDKAKTSHIVLVSDCIHNAKTTALAEVPDCVELIAVNTNDKDNLGELISKRFLTFDQVLNFLF